MDMIDFKQITQYRENNCLEVKEAQGGLPESIWRTYSAFANTQGGIIVLGVKELDDKSLEIIGVKNPEKQIKEFWDIVNNQKKVSVNILREKNVFIEEVNGKRIIVISVPRANRQDKPVHLTEDFFKGTFRRNGEGDYHCTKSEVKNMLRDQSEISQDKKVLDEFSFDSLNKETILSYRNYFRSSRGNHPWIKITDEEFLEKIGALGRSEDDNKLHPTAAGLLMFGDEYQIVQEFPYYFLDYQEKLTHHIEWTDRIYSSSGDWSGNVFDFYLKVTPMLFKYIKIPFKLEGIHRVDDTPAHKAVREGLVNALIHSDYYERRGLVVEQFASEIKISNPGAFRINISEALNGGLSDARNATIMKMFTLLSIGEHAGSGLYRIYSTWEDNGEEKPILQERFNPDRTVLILKFNENRLVTSEKKPKNLYVKPQNMGVDDEFVGVNDTNLHANEEKLYVKPENVGVNDTSLHVKSQNMGVNDTTLHAKSQNMYVNKESLHVKSLSQMILNIIKKNPETTYQTLIQELDVSRETIRKTIKKLKNNGVIKRIGSDKNGHWDIISPKI